MFDVITGTLASALATSGTLTIAYPTGRSRGDYLGGIKHRFITDGGGVYVAPTDFELTLNATASGITLTWRATATVPTGTGWRLELDGLGANVDPATAVSELDRAYRTMKAIPYATTVMPGTLQIMNLGSPVTADADGYCASQSVTASVAALINGALAVSSVGIADVPRNVVAAWTNTAVCTVVGEDVYGNAISEASGSGTSLAGKKAFARVTSVTFSANVTGATVGTGDVLGLPAYLPGTGYVLKELENGAAATAGTIVAGVLTKPTTTTGDVRGTYDPNSACDGSKAFVLIVAGGDLRYSDLAQA